MSYWVKVVETSSSEARQAWEAWLATSGLATDSVDRGEMKIDTIRDSRGADTVRYFVSIDEARRLGLPEADG